MTGVFTIVISCEHSKDSLCFPSKFLSPDSSTWENEESKIAKKLEIQALSLILWCSWVLLGWMQVHFLVCFGIIFAGHLHKSNVDL